MLEAQSTTAGASQPRLKGGGEEEIEPFPKSTGTIEAEEEESGGRGEEEEE